MSKYVSRPIELGIDTNQPGVYLMGEDRWVEAMAYTDILQFGVGHTPKGTVEERMVSLSSSKDPYCDKFVLDMILRPGYRDHDLHKILREDFAAQRKNEDTNRHLELFEAKVPIALLQDFKASNSFDPIRKWLVNEFRNCAAKLNPNHKKQRCSLRGVQKYVKDLLVGMIEDTGTSINVICELAARIGKTILFLDLAATLHKQFGHKAMLVMAYGVGLGIKTSYIEECRRWSNFKDLMFIDASDAPKKKAAKQYAEAIKNGKIPVVFISLNPTDAKEKYQWIHKLTGTFLVVEEETDFGSHTENQVDKAEYICGNKEVTRLSTSGTNAGRLAKAFGKAVINKTISIPYCMVEQDKSIPNVVNRKFYNMLFDPSMNDLLEDFDKSVLPNITKILLKPLAQQRFLSALFKDLFDYDPIYGLSISQEAGEPIMHCMLFVNITNKAMKQLARIIETACPEHKVLILNGNETSNKEAEGKTKEELIRLRNGYYGTRDKLLVITNMMGTRSYTIGEIQACLFMQEGGSVYPFQQKYSRCLTPFPGKKCGHIFDFSFDQSKTRNTEMSIAIDAAKLAKEENIDYPNALRTVMNSASLKDVLSGTWHSVDDIIKKFEDNNKLLEIANASTRIDVKELTWEEREAFGELAKHATSSKKEKQNIEKTVDTGSTYGKGASDDEGSPRNGKGQQGRPRKDPLVAMVEKAVRTINSSATTVLALSNYQGETFLGCISIIDAEEKLKNEFVDLYGVTPETIIRLSPHLQIPTLDLIVYRSKYDNIEKHVESNTLALIKDDPELWKTILSAREIRRTIQSIKRRKNGRVLVVAGGYGTEVDVLVELYGLAITKKIVYNDRYQFFCNQIKRKYPDITIEKGDFLQLKFNRKFDVVLGNPPYNHPTNKSIKLWSEFAVKALALSENSVIMITPSTWLVRPKARAFRVFTKAISTHLIEVCSNVSSYFPNIGETIGYWRASPDWQKSFTVDGSAYAYAYNQQIITDRKDLLLVEKLKQAFKKHTLLRDVKIIDFYYSTKEAVRTGRLSAEKTVEYNIPVFITSKQIKYTKIEHITPCYKLILNKSGYYYKEGEQDRLMFVPDTENYGVGEGGVGIPADSIEEAKCARDIYSKKIFRFYIDNEKSGGFNSGLLDLPLMDISRTWSDEQLYKEFELNQEEIKIIEDSYNNV